MKRRPHTRRAARMAYQIAEALLLLVAILISAHAFLT